MWIGNIFDRFTKKEIQVGSKVAWKCMVGKKRGIVEKIAKNLAKVRFDSTPFGGYSTIWLDLKRLKAE